MFGPCFVMHFLVSYLVLQSSLMRKREIVVYFNCLPDEL